MSQWVSWGCGGRSCSGVVVAVGPGKYADQTGNLIPLSVKVGDQVLYSKYGGTEVTIEGTEYLIMRDSDILGTL